MILFGQSAGGASVDFYAYSYTKDPIVYGFIPQSGSASGRRAATSPLAATAAESAAVGTWSKLSQDIGCGPVSGTEVTKTLSCMKGKDVTKVLDATQPKSSGAALASWGPKADDQTVMSNIGAVRAPKGQFIKAVSIPARPVFLLPTNTLPARPRRQHQQRGRLLRRQDQQPLEQGLGLRGRPHGQGAPRCWRAGLALPL
jgi:hypothetical protein